MNPAKIKRIKFVIVSTVLINVIGMGIIIPVLPHYVESFNTSELAVTLLFGVFAFCSFISSPFLGALSDRIGRKPIFLLWLIPFVGVFFFLMGAPFLSMFVAGLIVIGFGQSTLRPVMTSQIVGKSPRETQGEIIGVTSSIQSVRMTFSPVIAGMVFHFKNNLPLYLSGIYLVIAFVITCADRRTKSLH